jgi:hypothetical protein
MTDDREPAGLDPSALFEGEGEAGAWMRSCLASANPEYPE